MKLQRIFTWFTPDDWQRSIAIVILWAYAYNLVVWGPMFWLTTLATAIGDHYHPGFLIPAPPLVPWEHLLTGTTTLGMIGGISGWRENNRMKHAPQSIDTTQSSEATGTVVSR